MIDITLAPQAAAQRIGKLVRRMMAFWENVAGWAPESATSLLNKSMLNWQSSLADSLTLWTGELTDGELILVWTNIGAIVEGQLKLLLSVYHTDYAYDELSVNWDGDFISQDGLALDKLREFFKRRIWEQNDPWNDWVWLVQQRRNAIHAFKSRNIGTAEELHRSLTTLLLFTRDINARLPYPDSVTAPNDL